MKLPKLPPMMKLPKLPPMMKLPKLPLMMKLEMVLQHFLGHLFLAAAASSFWYGTLIYSNNTSLRCELRQMSGFSTMNKFNLSIEICFQSSWSWFHLKALSIYETGITKYRRLSIKNLTQLPSKSEVRIDAKFSPNVGNFLVEQIQFKHWNKTNFLKVELIRVTVRVRVKT